MQSLHVSDKLENCSYIFKRHTVWCKVFKVS